MAGHGLNTVSRLQCPHGGQVQIQSTNTRSKTLGSPMASTADVYTIVGCPFQLPGPTPSPCVRVQWLVPDSRVRVNGSYTLSRSSTGLCLSAAGVPQGQVILVTTQAREQSQ